MYLHVKRKQIRVDTVCFNPVLVGGKFAPQVDFLNNSSRRKARLRNFWLFDATYCGTAHGVSSKYLNT